MNFNVKLLPQCLGYHDNQNVNLPPITRLCNRVSTGCNGWSFTLELELKMVQNKSTNWIIHLQPFMQHDMIILRIVDSMIMNFQNSVKLNQNNLHK